MKKILVALTRRWKEPNTEGEPMSTEQVTLVPTLIEKFVLTNGDEVQIYRPRVRHYMNVKQAAGSKVEDGHITNKHSMIDLRTVVRRVAIGRNPGTGEYVEAPELPLPSEV
jgi:hypothetical protein